MTDREILTMNQAVERLSASQRREQMDIEDQEGDQEPAQEVDDDTELFGGDEETFQTEVDGRMVDVPVSQIPERYRAPQTASLAPPVPLAQPAVQQLDTSRINELDRTISDLRGQAVRPSLPDEKLIDEEDPYQFNKAMAHYNVATARAEDAQRKLEEAERNRGQEVQNYQNQVALGQQQQLAQVWPEWADPVKHPKIRAKMIDYAQRRGYSPQEAEMLANGQVDPRLTLQIRDGMRGEILAKKAKPGRKARGSAPKVGAPGVRQTDDGKKSVRREEFLRRADREGVSVQGAADFLAGRYS